MYNLQTPMNRDRQYKLLPKDIIFCSGLIESHGDNYTVSVYMMMWGYTWWLLRLWLEMPVTSTRKMPEDCKERSEFSRNRPISRHIWGPRRKEWPLKACWPKNNTELCPFVSSRPHFRWSSPAPFFQSILWVFYYAPSVMLCGFLRSNALKPYTAVTTPSPRTIYPLSPSPVLVLFVSPVCSVLVILSITLLYYNIHFPECYLMDDVNE